MMSSKKTKQISISEYVSKIDPIYFRGSNRGDKKITEQSIRKRIKKSQELPDVIRYDKVGKVHILTVNVNF